MRGAVTFDVVASLSAIHLEFWNVVFMTARRCLLTQLNNLLSVVLLFLGLFHESHVEVTQDDIRFVARDTVEDITEKLLVRRSSFLVFTVSCMRRGRTIALIQKGCGINTDQHNSAVNLSRVTVVGFNMCIHMFQI